MSRLACDAVLMSAFIMEAAVDNAARYENFLRYSDTDGALEKVSRLTEMAIPFAVIQHEMLTGGYEIPGVFAYEVAVEYGAWYLSYVEQSNEEPCWPECMKKARMLVCSFYSSDEEALRFLETGPVFTKAGIALPVMATAPTRDAAEEHY